MLLVFIQTIQNLPYDYYSASAFGTAQYYFWQPSIARIKYSTTTKFH